MTQPTLLLMMVAGAAALIDWRRGLLMCVVVGIAQDPLRKLAPGEPVYYVMLVLVTLALTLVRAHLARVNLSPSALNPIRPDLKLAFGLFVVLVLAQAMHSFVAYRSYLLTGIGLLVWLTPVPAVVVAYQFATRRGLQAVRHWMAAYCVLTMLALSGVYLEYSGVDWPALGEVGEGLPIYDLGTILKAYSGFFRSSEIAAWHTATVACFIFTLSLGKRATIVRTLAALALIGALVTLGILTGRRKMLMEILIFLGTYLFLYASVQRGAARLAMGAVIASVAAYIVVVGFVQPDLVQHSATKEIQLEDATRIEGYAMRGQSVFADLPHRVSAIGVDPVMWALDAHGWLGAGLGSGSQGTQQVAEQYGIRSGAAEGGLGKVALELGLPGIPLVIWLAVALARQVKDHLRLTTRLSAQHMRMSFGLIAFLVANVATFSIATQAYSDPFILILIGWSLGFLFAMPVLAWRHATRPSRPARDARFEAPTVPGNYPGPAIPAAPAR